MRRVAESSEIDTFASRLSRQELVPHFRRRDGLLLADKPDLYTDRFQSDSTTTFYHVDGGGGIGSISFGVGPIYLPPSLNISHIMFEPTFAVAIDVSRPVPPGPPCDQIEMVLERTTYAGRLTRTLEIPDFRMDDGTSAQ